MIHIVAVAVCALSALLQVAVHVYAWQRPWTRVTRYLAGAAVANVAITAAYWLTLPAEYALIATGYLWSVYIADGLAVGACYEERKRRATTSDQDDPTPDAARLIAQLNRELYDGDLSDTP